MEFDGHHDTLTNSLFPSYQQQVSMNVGAGSKGRTALPFVRSPSVSLQEQDMAAFAPWSSNTHDDSYELFKCAQSSIKSRQATDSTDHDRETDLQGLVSNILDEAETLDSYYSERNSLTRNPVWSPKTLKEELLQYQSEAKTQHSSNFPPNHISSEVFSKAQGQSVGKGDIHQQPNGLTNNHQWLLNLLNGDKDSLTIQPQRLPPGLPIPNMGNAYLSQQSTYDNMSDTDRGNSQPVNSFPDFSNVFRPQSEMNSSCFDLSYEDHHSQSSAKPISNEQRVPQDINQLVSSFQSFLAGHHDGLCRDFPTIHRQTAGVYHEDSMREQWKVVGPAVSPQSTPVTQAQKQMVGDFGTMQRETNGVVRKHTSKHGGFQDLHAVRPQNTEIFQSPNPLPASLNFPNQFQSKMTLHRENTSLPINMSMSQYSNHQIQQGHTQNKIRPQMQKEKKGMHMSGIVRETFSTRAHTSTYPREADKKQGLSQNLYFDRLGSVQSQRFDGENGVVTLGNTQQFMPLLYHVNNPKRYPRPLNSSNIPSRSTSPYGNGLPCMDQCDVSATEPTAFNSYLKDTITCRREGIYHGIVAEMSSPVVMNQGGPVIQLQFYLDECFEQWRCLKNERNKTEFILTKTFLGKRTAAVTQPKTPPNPSRVDHIIVNQMMEQARVASLLHRIECLRNLPLHISIHTALNRHHMAICFTQARRKEELANMSKHQLTDDRDTLMLAIALKELSATTRKLCSALWCALQMTMLKPVKRQDHVNREATCRETCPSPFEECSFKL